MYDIIKLLDLEDENIIVSDSRIEEQKKIITLTSKIKQHYCPKCGCIMHSKGIKIRTIKHPILQDGYNLILELKQRRWKCTNVNCLYDMQEHMNFVNKNRKITNVTEMMIVVAFKDINKTAEEIGRAHNLSGHAVMDIFDRYIHPKRASLPEALSVDEVYLNMDSKCKYVLVLQNFETGEPIDLVVSRRQEYTLPYFSNIPKSERFNVKYVISDMYHPYIDYVNHYFPNASSIVDSFHVMQWIINKLDLYIRQLVRKFKERDEINYKNSTKSRINSENIPLSDEVYLLQNYRWFLLKNQSNIDYKSTKKYNQHFKRTIDTYELEYKFFGIDSNLKILRDLKEKYVEFNSTFAGQSELAAIELEYLIDYYKKCGQKIFVEFAGMLFKYKQPIINSFIHFNKINSNGESVMTRLSNGPIESLNRKAKDLKRNGRGYTNFEHLRKRFLFATRDGLQL